MRQLCFGLALLAWLPASETRAATSKLEPLFPTDVCKPFYPGALAAAHVEGQVTLTFVVAPDGTTQNILVGAPSGNADLDEAAQKCVASLRYRTSQSFARQVHIVWSFGPDGLVSSIDVPHQCNSYYPAAELKQGITGTTVLGFTVESDGSVGNIKVVTGSGNTNLDAAAVTCAQRWRYRPATQDTKPVAASWQVAVVWQPPSPPFK